MLLALAKHFCGADNGDAQVEADMYAKALTATTTNTDEQLLEDPLLEAVYDDMDEEDKGEFPEIGVAKRKKKYQARFGAWTRARLGPSGPRAKNRAKAKARAQAAAPPAEPSVAEPSAAPAAPPTAQAAPPAVVAAPEAPPKAGPAAPPAEVAAPPAPPPAGPAAPPAADAVAHPRAVANYRVTWGWEDIPCDYWVQQNRTCCR